MTFVQEFSVYFLHFQKMGELFVIFKNWGKGIIDDLEALTWDKDPMRWMARWVGTGTEWQPHGAEENQTRTFENKYCMGAKSPLVRLTTGTLLGESSEGKVWVTNCMFRFCNQCSAKKLLQSNFPQLWFVLCFVELIEYCEGFVW